MAGRSAAVGRGSPSWLGWWPLTFVVSRSCQQDQIRITKQQAIATAERQVKFDPTRVQMRMLRQGLNSQAELDRVAVDPAHAAP